jgi:hypothetical protein
MKIAALALASALTAAVGSAQPSFAQNIGQNDQNQYNKDQYNGQDQNDLDQYERSDMNGQNQGEDMNEESSTTGQNMSGNNNSNGNNQYGQFQNPNDNNNSNNNNWRKNRMGSNGPNWQNEHHHWRMEGRMSPMWHQRMMGMMARQGARFSLSNGAARMNVQCPPNEPTQACVQAAGQLLDKISSLRSNAGASSTSSGSTGSSNATIPGATVPPMVTSPTGQ